MFTFREQFPEYIKNRLLFRYHVYRSLYFLEQGSGKGVKKEVKTSTDYYLLFSNDSNEDYLDHIKSTVSSAVFNGNMALDSFENITPIDGYLPPILKTRLEFRRGNSMKILSVLNQIYEAEEGEASDVVPSKDCFYYSMLSSVYYSGGLYFQAKFYIHKAIQVLILPTCSLACCIGRAGRDNPELAAEEPGEHMHSCQPEGRSLAGPPPGHSASPAEPLVVVPLWRAVLPAVLRALAALGAVALFPPAQ